MNVKLILVAGNSGNINMNGESCGLASKLFYAKSLVGEYKISYT